MELLYLIYSKVYFIETVTAIRRVAVIMTRNKLVMICCFFVEEDYHTCKIIQV